MNIDQETLSSLLSRVSLSLPRLITAVVIFAVMLFLAGLVAKLIQRACNKRKLDREATTGSTHRRLTSGPRKTRA